MKDARKFDLVTLPQRAACSIGLFKGAIQPDRTLVIGSQQAVITEPRELLA